MTLTLLTMLAALQQGQPPAPPPAAAPVAPAAPAEEWHRIAKSDTRAYLVNVGGIADTDGDATIRLASVPRQPDDAADRSRMVDDYAFNCSTKKFRVTNSIDVPPEGGEGEAFADPEAAWDDIPDRGLIATLADVVCDRARSADAVYPTLEAYMAGERD